MEENCIEAFSLFCICVALDSTRIISARIFPCCVSNLIFFLVFSISPCDKGGRKAKGIKSDGSIVKDPLIESWTLEMETKFALLEGILNGGGGGGGGGDGGNGGDGERIEDSREA